MYPKLGDFGQQGPGMNNPMQHGGSYGQQGPSHWVPPPMNGPQIPSGNNLPNLPTNSSYSHPTLRVHIADHLRTTPSVMVHRGASEIPGTTFNFNFDYERQLQQRLQSTNQAENRGFKNDPIESLREDLASTDYTWEEISFATTALTGSKPDTDQVKVYCQNYRELKSMGFDSALVTGALLLHKQDLPAATDACLNSQS